MRADPDARRLWLAVTELWPPEAGASFASRGGARRRAIGSALHGRYQRAALEADPRCRSEVPLTGELAHDGWQVVLRGRADLVRPDPHREGGWLVEELKSAWSVPTPRAGPAQRQHLQAAAYGALWQRHTGAPTRVELVWLPIGEGPVAREPVCLDPPALEAALRAGLDRRLRELAARQQRGERCRRASEAVRFPHPAVRPGQRALTQAVEDALSRREHLLVEAPTGLGKTAAVLTPALRFALRENKRLLVLTATGLQQRGALAALRRLAPSALPTAVQLRAKARMCLNDRLLCHEAACRFARNTPGRLADGSLVERTLAGRTVVEPEHVLASARQAEVCPFELSLDAARGVTATLADYNYVFDPVVRLLRPDDEDLTDVVLVVDEFHNVAARARDAHSAVLDGAQLERTTEAVALRGAPVHAAQAALCRALRERLDDVLADAGIGSPAAAEAWEVAHPLPADLLEPLLERFDLGFLATLAYRHATGSMDEEDPFLALYFALRRFADALAQPGPAFASTIGWQQGAPRLRRLCLDPAPSLAPLLNRCHAVVGLSATLGPAELQRDAVGLDPDRTRHVVVPDPFPAERRQLVIDPGVDTTAARRGRQAAGIARRLAALAEAVPGHCLALLPSHAFLAELRPQLPALTRPLHWQEPGDGPEERQALLEQLAGDDALVLAVAGGVFAEGVELPPGRLAAVAVVGPCLPAADLERRLLEQLHDEGSGRGFELAYAVPGMTRVIQAAGRLIRGPGDRGVIALLGRRFLRSPYRELLPEPWLRGGQPEDWVGDAAQVARSFFAAS